MSAISWFIFCAAVLLLVAIVKGSASDGSGGCDDEDPNQFVGNELDPRYPANLTLQDHHFVDDFDDLQIHAMDHNED